MSGQTPAEMIGAVLNGRWRLLRLLGEGAMGAVFEAEGPPTVGKRAVKMLHAEYAKEAVILARFFAEFQAARAINHPNVAHVQETAKSEAGIPYFVMELLQGTPVATYVDQRQALPVAQAVHIAHGVLQALSVAHGYGIVHRDIKPENLYLVNDNAGSFNVKVLDFGIAKVMDAAGGMGQKTRTGVLLGTPGYMSPEQIRDSRAVDGRADLWSVGIILYELLTGASPFPADNEFTRLTSVLTEEIKPISEVAPQLAAWTGFFQRALAKDPAQRFQTADEMDTALFATMRGRSMRPPPAAQAQGPLATLALDVEQPSQGSFRPAIPSAVSKNALQTTAMQAYVESPSSTGLGPLSAPKSAFGGTKPMPHSIQAIANAFSLPAGTPGPTAASSSAVMQAPKPPETRPPGSLAAVAAVSQGSVPPPQIVPALLATEPMVTPSPAQLLALAPSLPIAPVAPAQIAPTHVSANGPEPAAARGVTIAVVDPPPRAGAPYWVVVVVGLVMLGAGFALEHFLRW